MSKCFYTTHESLGMKQEYFPQSLGQAEWLLAMVGPLGIVLGPILVVLWQASVGAILAGAGCVCFGLWMVVLYRRSKRCHLTVCEKGIEFESLQGHGCFLFSDVLEFSCLTCANPTQMGADAGATVTLTFLLRPSGSVTLPTRVQWVTWTKRTGEAFPLKETLENKLQHLPQYE